VQRVTELWVRLPGTAGLLVAFPIGRSTLIVSVKPRNCDREPKYEVRAGGALIV
jgi:hypothetical protein